MKIFTPEISWHNRLPTLALDIEPRCEAGHYRIATGGNDCRVYIWLINPNTLEIRIRAGLRRHQKSVGAVRFSRQNILASGDDDGYIYLWKQKIEDPSNQQAHTADTFMNDDGFEDIETWQHLKVLRGHIEDICDLAWSRDGAYLLSGSVDNSAILWDTTKGTKVWCSDQMKGYVQGVAIDPHLQFFVTLSSDRTLRSFNFNDRKIINATRQMNIKGSPYKALFCDDTVQTFCRRFEFSPDGQFLIAPTCRLVDRESKQTPATGDSPTHPSSERINVFLVFRRHALNKPIHYYQTGKEVALCVRFAPIVYKLRKSEQNFWGIPYRIVFAVATTRSVIIYDSQQPTPIAYVSQIHLARLTDISWSRDGRMLMISSYDGYTSIITFNRDEIGELYTDALLDPVQEVPKEAPKEQAPPPPPPVKVPEPLTIRRFLVKRV